MCEKWKDVVGYEGIYQVSDKGQVRRTLAGKGTRCGILKQGCRVVHTSVGGLTYRFVILSYKGVTKNKSVHRLVAEAFIPNPEGKPTVNHKDGDGENNVASNLEWATQSEQEKHKWGILGHCVKSDRFGVPPEAVKCLETGEIFSSKREACRKKAIDRKDLYLHLKGSKEAVKGLHFLQVSVQ